MKLSESGFRFYFRTCDLARVARIKNGVEDIYPVQDFHAGHGGRCGSECDVSLAFPVVAGIQGPLKLADHRAEGSGHDDARLRRPFEGCGRQMLQGGHLGATAHEGMPAAVT